MKNFFIGSISLLMNCMSMQVLKFYQCGFEKNKKDNVWLQTHSSSLSSSDLQLINKLTVNRFLEFFLSGQKAMKESINSIVNCFNFSFQFKRAGEVEISGLKNITGLTTNLRNSKFTRGTFLL